MTKLHLTQLGYGILPSNEKVQTSLDDGLFIIDLYSGICRTLITIREIITSVGLPKENPTFGFHTKWSDDGQRILFILRTFDPAMRIDGLLAGKKFRSQHLIVMNYDGVNISEIRRVFSWGSKPVLRGKSQDFDGNHPNWVPGSHRISMNIGKMAVASTDFKAYVDGLGPFESKNVAQWRLAVFDADDPSAGPRYVYSKGSGHPSFHSNQRFVITDAYAKERSWFKSSSSGTVPLRLIDVKTHQEICLLQVLLYIIDE